ncbi:MAG: hypothetical protein E4G99_02295 [Anaerolineales bacterium]|nr:MAG: hypothetical protein E4G99_02295 [Anaerolineales bacterium]
MARRRRPKRYRLSLYRQILRRHRILVFLLAIFLSILGLLSGLRWVSWPQAEASRWFLGASALATLYWFFSMLGPALAHVQPRQDHLRLQTPFYRLNISYRRIRNTRPVDIAQTFPREMIPRGFQRSMRHFYGRTALAVDLSSWPLPRRLLIFLLGKMILAPDRPGFILITPDWMALSHELETMMSEWGEDQRKREWHSGANVAEILRGGEDG